MTIMFFLPYFNTLVTETLNIFLGILASTAPILFSFTCNDLQKIPLYNVIECQCSWAQAYFCLLQTKNKKLGLMQGEDNNKTWDI